jgi:uncharacterized protein YuzE
MKGEVNFVERLKMENRYLEVTFRKGKPFAAYFYLSRNPDEKSSRTEKVGGRILIDYGKSGRPIGIEIIDPNKINLHAINEILMKLNLHPAEEKDLTPLLAA